MNFFDVIVVGAGPAGGHCARKLAAANKKVLLIDKAKDFTVNNYSSGGVPLDFLEHYQLPNSIIGTEWNKLCFVTSNEYQMWSSPTPVGYVIEFKSLRQFLANETQGRGGVVKLGYSYKSHQKEKDQTAVLLKNQQSGETETFFTKVLVDATGCERKVLLNGKYDKRHSMTVPGIEFLIEVDPMTYQKYAHALHFYWGQKWMPQGYAWIFPMEQNKLKIGVVRYFAHEHFVPHEESYQHYLDKFIEMTIGTSSPNIIDRHGKTITYTYHQRDPLYNDNVIAIGDAVSTINPLAFEGIRHAMRSGEIAAKHIVDFLNGESKSFSGYASDLKRYYGIKWRLSEWVMNKIYKEPDDRKVDLMMQTFKSFDFKSVLDFSFGYSLKEMIRFYLRYLPKTWFLSRRP